VVIVYIMEAHASDTWPMAFKGEKPSPKDLNQRIKYAQACAAEHGFPVSFRVLVDSMTNDFNAAFGAWPTCYYVVGEDKKLNYVGECPLDSESATYDVNELFTHLNAMA